MNIRTALCAFVGLVSVTACGTQSSEQTFVTQYESGFAMQERLEARSGTVWEEMPTSGTAQFMGHALITLGPDDNETEITGLSEVNVNFGSNTVDGKLTDFFGQTPDDEIGAYIGEVILAEGGISDTKPNDIFTNFEGELEGQDTVVKLDGTLGGRFIGTPIKGIWMQTESGTFTSNDKPVEGGLFVIGEK